MTPRDPPSSGFQKVIPKQAQTLRHTCRHLRVPHGLMYPQQLPLYSHTQITSSKPQLCRQPPLSSIYPVPIGSQNLSLGLTLEAQITLILVHTVTHNSHKVTCGHNCVAPHTMCRATPKTRGVTCTHSVTHPPHSQLHSSQMASATQLHTPSHRHTGP